MPFRAVGLKGAVAAGALGVSNALAWAASLDAGMIAGSITILGLALIGFVTQGIKTLGPAWIEFRKARADADAEIAAKLDKLNESSLTRQLDGLKQDTEKLRRSLHEANGSLQRNQAMHVEETERLTRQLDLVTEQLEATTRELREAKEELRAAHDENRKLLARIEDVGRQVRDNAGAIEAMQAQAASPPRGAAS